MSLLEKVAQITGVPLETLKQRAREVTADPEVRKMLLQKAQVSPLNRREQEIAVPVQVFGREGWG